METLTLADGTVIQAAHAMESGGGLWFYVNSGMTLDAVYQLMSNPEKTRTVTALRFGEKTVYAGYTDLQSIRKDEGQVSGCLRKS